jgi:hypothetical protein
VREAFKAKPCMHGMQCRNRASCLYSHPDEAPGPLPSLGMAY